MDRLRAPTEFGFTTPPYIPPDRPRPTWKTLAFGALLTVIPLVGPGVGAVYIDRRRIPGTYEFGPALKTALLQVLAVALLLLVCWIVFGLVLGVGIELNPRLVRH